MDFPQITAAVGVEQLCPVGDAGDIAFLAQYAAGRVAFIGTLQGTGVKASSDAVVATNAFGALELVAREGDHPPESPAGARWESFTTVALDALGSPSGALGVSRSFNRTAGVAVLIFFTDGTRQIRRIAIA